MNNHISHLSLVYSQLSAFAGLDSFWQTFETVYGSQYDFATAESIRTQWAKGDFSELPLIEVVSAEVLGSALGAYAISNNTIYLSEALLASSSEQIVAVILEEIGHYVDAHVNVSDTAGDEGELFSAVLLGKTLSPEESLRIQTEDDFALITLDGEQVAANTVVGNLSSTDPDTGNTFTYTLVPGTGSTDNASFSIINGNQLSINASPDFETKSNYSVRVRTTDQGGLTYEKALTIGVNNLNDAPINLSLSATTINENVAVNTIIGSLSSTDPDTGNTFTYSLVSGTGSTDNASFSIINGNQLSINASPDFETKSSYSVRVRTTDQGGLTYEKALTIGVNNVNDIPVLVNNVAIPVNQGNSVAITSALLQTTDQDNTSAQLTYTLASLPGAGTLRLNGNALALGGKFTQDDINNGRVVYAQNGASAIGDSFNFTVSDNAVNPSTTRISVATGGTQSNGNSSSISISADGRYVVYESDASNLVSGDTNGNTDIFLYDRQTGTTSLISVSSGGVQGNSSSQNPAISGDGRYVTYYSNASNLVSGDTNNGFDIFVYDRQTSETSRVSITSAGGQGTRAPFNALAYDPSISADGRYVAYSSENTNLVSGDTNNASDIFVFDRQTGTASRVSVSSSSAQGNGSSVNPTISADGRYVTYSSSASNLVSGDTNSKSDIFVHDRQTGITSRVSVGSDGTQSNNNSTTPSISADGRYVTYSSSASNLVSGDTNFLTDIFLYDRQTSITSRISVDSSGIQGNNDSLNPSISADGRYITYSSSADNLVNGDVNGATDIFVYDRLAGTTRRVSVNSDGAEGNSSSGDLNSFIGFRPEMSADGRYIAYFSSASNLVTGDSNGVRDIFIGDLGFLSGTSTIAVNNNPTNLTLSSNAIDENVPANTVVGSLSATDPDTANTFTYSLVSGTGDADNTLFSIINDNQLRINTSPDYETQSSYSIRVRATDQGGATYEKALVIGVNNINETPSNLSLSAITVNENVGLFSEVGIFSAADPDAGDTFTYSLVSGAGDVDNNAFLIGDYFSDGQIRLVTNALINYEQKDSYSIRVRTTDQGGLNYEKALTITVNDQDDRPVISGPSGNSSSGPSVGNPQIIEEDPAFPGLVFSSANGNAITVSDEDANANQVIYTLELYLMSSGFGGFGGFGGGNFTLSQPLPNNQGTLSEINAALEGASFTPDMNFNGNVYLDIYVKNEQGNPIGGISPGVYLNIPIQVTPVNDAPELMLNFSSLDWDEGV